MVEADATIRALPARVACSPPCCAGAPLSVLSVDAALAVSLCPTLLFALSSLALSSLVLSIAAAAAAEEEDGAVLCCCASKGTSLRMLR